MNATHSGKFRQLSNAEWLASRYRLVGDGTIAAEVGCSEATVRRARHKLGILSFRPGPRTTTEIPLQLATSDSERRSITGRGELILNGSLAALQARLSEDQHHRTPPSRETLIARCQHWLDAERNHEPAASQDTLLSIASAALLIHEHQNKLRRRT